MASTGAIQKDFSLLCIKDNLSIIENLPEEILLEICTYLGLKDLGRCLQVSKRFRKITKDEKLWQRITLFRKEVPIEFIGQFLDFGLKHLSVKECELKHKIKRKRNRMAMILDLFPKKNELKSLELTNLMFMDRFGIYEKSTALRALLESCHSLEKLYFGGSWNLDHLQVRAINFPKTIVENGKTLMVLNLLNDDVQSYFEDHPGSVQLIIANCTELKELALPRLKSVDFGIVCSELTPKIRKLKIANRSKRLEHDKYVEILTKRCHGLIVFSLGLPACGLPNTSFPASFAIIVKNLALSLEKLEFSRWPINQEDMVEMLELRSMSKLEILCLNECFSRRDEEENCKIFFELNLPHLKVMIGGVHGCGCGGNMDMDMDRQTRDVMGIAVQEGKEQKSKLDLFRDLEIEL